MRERASDEQTDACCRTQISDPRRSAIEYQLAEQAFVTPQIEEWAGVLYTTSKVILLEKHDGERNTNEIESLDFAGLIFYEESIAKRVLEAFKHAADLCRGKEPF
jgi:hypothetical protein